MSNFVTNYNLLSLTTNPKFQLNLNNIKLDNTSINISTVYINFTTTALIIQNYKQLINELVVPVPSQGNSLSH